MYRITEHEADLLREQLISCDPVSMLLDIQAWQQEVTSDRTYAILDTVADLIIDNCTFSD